MGSPTLRYLVAYVAIHRSRYCVRARWWAVYAHRTCTLTFSQSLGKRLCGSGIRTAPRPALFLMHAEGVYCLMGGGCCSVRKVCVRVWEAGLSLPFARYQHGSPHGHFAETVALPASARAPPRRRTRRCRVIAVSVPGTYSLSKVDIMRSSIA